MALITVKGKLSSSSPMANITLQTSNVAFIIDDPGPGAFVQVHCNGTVFLTDFPGANAIRTAMNGL